MKTQEEGYWTPEIKMDNLSQIILLSHERRKLKNIELETKRKR
jgi:hypothetical protein